MAVIDRIGFGGGRPGHDAASAYGGLGPRVNFDTRQLVPGKNIDSVGRRPWDDMTAAEARMYPAWYRACVLLSTIVGGMEIDVKRAEREDGGIKLTDATDHPSFWPVCIQANEEVTASQWRTRMIWQAVQYGASRAGIVRSAGRPIQILAFGPHQCWPERIEGKKWYMVDPYRQYEKDPIVVRRMRKLDPADVIEIALPSDDGFYPDEPWDVGRRALYTGVASARVRAARSVNSGRPRLALCTPKAMNKDSVERIRTEFPIIHSGLDDQVVPAILDNDLKPHALPYQPEYEAEAALSGLSLRDVSNLTGVPATFLGDNEGRSYNAFEYDVKALYEFGVGFWLTQLEDQFKAKMLTDKERRNRSILPMFDRQTTRFADTKVLAELIRALGAGAPIAKINEIRAKLNMSALDDPEAKRLYFPKNMGQGGADNKSGDTPPGDPGGPASRVAQKTQENPARENPPTGEFNSAGDGEAITRHIAKRIGARIANEASRKAGDANRYMAFAGGELLERYHDHVCEDFGALVEDVPSWAGRDASRVTTAWLSAWAEGLLELAGAAKAHELDATVRAGVVVMQATMPGRLLEILKGPAT